MSTAKWANIGEDAGALHALVQRIEQHVAISTVDYLWIFPARKVPSGESTVIVIGAFADEPDRRRVITAHFTVSRNKRGEPFVKAAFDEQGSTPEGAVPRIVQGVLRRLGAEIDEPPRAEQIGGDTTRWNTLIVDLGGMPSASDPDDIDADNAGTDASQSDTAPEPDDRVADS